MPLPGSGRGDPKLAVRRPAPEVTVRMCRVPAVSQKTVRSSAAAFLACEHHHILSVVDFTRVHRPLLGLLINAAADVVHRLFHETVFLLFHSSRISFLTCSPEYYNYAFIFTARDCASLCFAQAVFRQSVNHTRRIIQSS